MITTAGPADAVSFTDDTSLDTRKTGRSKVSIHCQAERERPLDWYYSLLRRAPTKSGEVKSKDITDVFLALAPPERRKTLTTLKHVRVNITDPRPYQADIKAMLGSIVPGVDAEEFLRRLEHAEECVAENVRRTTRQFATHRMLWDSPSERLRLRHRALTWFPSWPELEQAGKDLLPDLEDIDLSAFDDGTRPINLNAVSVFVSKSGSVFYPALDALDRTCEDLQSPPTAWNFWGVGRALRDFHVFDDGNRKAITWVDHKRTEALSLIDPYSHLGLGLSPKPFEGIDSKDSYFVQAADFAAGIVTEILERETLVQVARSFDYVTYNGKRIGEMDAAFITAKLHGPSKN